MIRRPLIAVWLQVRVLPINTFEVGAGGSTKLPPQDCARLHRVGPNSAFSRAISKLN
jgi:hypothetical protein